MFEALGSALEVCLNACLGLVVDEETAVFFIPKRKTTVSWSTGSAFIRLRDFCMMHC